MGLNPHAVKVQAPAYAGEERGRNEDGTRTEREGGARTERGRSEDGARTEREGAINRAPTKSFSARAGGELLFQSTGVQPRVFIL